jgi:hypothetical protein
LLFGNDRFVILFNLFEELLDARLRKAARRRADDERS